VISADERSLAVGYSVSPTPIGRSNLEVGDIAVTWNDSQDFDALVCFAMEDHVAADGVRADTLTEVAWP
jgi:hypothetical protein